MWRVKKTLLKGASPVVCDLTIGLAAAVRPSAPKALKAFLLLLSIYNSFYCTFRVLEIF